MEPKLLKSISSVVASIASITVSTLVYADEAIDVAGSEPVTNSLAITASQVLNYSGNTPLLAIIPESPTTVTNCIPFGENNNHRFRGFVYKDIPPFSMKVGDKIRFDLGALNDVDIRRNIFFSAANKNPDSSTCGSNVGSQGVKAIEWTQVVSESQVPTSPKGNTIQGDYELTYIAEAEFEFSGGGLIVGFQGNPPASYYDGNCEQVLVSTTCNDTSGNFYSRFFGQPDLTQDVLDSNSFGGTGVALGGMVIEPSTILVSIDIKPGSYPNSINLGSNGVISAAILGSDTVDVTTIDTETLSLGTSGVKTVGKKDKQLCKIEDVSGDFTISQEGAPDGYNDLVCNYETMTVVPEEGDTQIKLTGSFYNGIPLEGLDSVNIVPE